MLLRSAVGMAAPQATVPALGAAELVGAALEAFATDPDLLAAERARVQLLLVDDAQHLDPQAAHLVGVLAAGAELSIIAGDPNQAVFGYRGADPELLRDDDAPAVVLTASHRCAPAVARAVTGIARRLPGAGAGRDITGDEDRDGSLSVRIAASPHAESALIADALRRAHLIDGVPWSEMAVIVRSVPRAGAALARALTAAGVPVDQPSATALAEHPAVAALLTVLDATSARPRRRPRGGAGDRTDRPCRPGITATVASRPAQGRRQPATARLRRPARRSARRCAGGSARSARPAATPRRHGPLRGPAVRSGRRRIRRITLWQAWHHCGLQRRWLASIERGGQGGVQAGRDLDAVTGLFDVAEQYVARTAGASLTGLVDHVRAMVLPAVGRDDRRAGESVAVLSAHAALGREWDVVVIAGLQEGLWPNTVPRGGVLATQHLVDVLDGVADPMSGVMSTRAPLLAEERRLLVAALGRARNAGRRVTAVDGDGADEVGNAVPVLRRTRRAGHRRPHGCRPRPRPRAAGVGACRPGRQVARRGVRARRVRSKRRRVPVRQRSWPVSRWQASPAASPAQWYGTTALSTDEPLWSGDGSRRDAVPVTTPDPGRLPPAVAAGTPRRRRRTRRAVGAGFTGPRAGRRSRQG